MYWSRHTCTLLIERERERENTFICVVAYTHAHIHICLHTGYTHARIPITRTHACMHARTHAHTHTSAHSPMIRKHFTLSTNTFNMHLVGHTLIACIAETHACTHAQTQLEGHTDTVVGVSVHPKLSLIASCALAGTSVQAESRGGTQGVLVLAEYQKYKWR